MKSLVVYKASAGSGKTFRLAVEYIKLLINNPLSYRNILAVTFTNKATEEMKMRILSQLYGIWKQLDDSKQYTTVVCEELDMPIQQVAPLAGTALHYLIHDYNNFRVVTIDAFFQTVLRNLARELDLTANLRIELNDYQVEEMAVDKLIASLGKSDQMLVWIMNYITSNISDDKNWNVIGQIKSFGKTIFKDFYKSECSELTEFTSNDKQFDDYVNELKAVKEHARQQMNGYAEQFFAILSDNGLTPDDLKGKQRGICSYFNKLRGNDWSDSKCLTANLASSMENAENWTTKTSPQREIIMSLADSDFIPLLHQAEENRLHLWKLYLSADLTLRHLSQLRLLGCIDQEVRALNKEANRFLLSDTQQLLNALIDYSDSPFIFEKIGTRLDHVTIDEFQDTSTIQWQNFKILLEEAMSHGRGNLIVGDVKQSIYRWRSGDWRLLNDIESQFPHSTDQIETGVLDVNYRSEENIISFNNAFFHEAALIEHMSEKGINPLSAEQLERAYKDVRQEIPENKKGKTKGLVNVTLLPTKDYQQRMLDEVCNRIEMLMNSGIPSEKIAILLRVNKQIPLIADELKRRIPDIKLVSDEAFKLESSAAVNIIILAMRLLNHPDDMLTKAQLVKTWQRQVLHNPIADTLLFADLQQLDGHLPHAFVEESPMLRNLPLMELAEQLYSIFNITTLERESAYVCTFFDSISNYLQEYISDIDSFLEEWEKTLRTKTIQSDEIDGIRLISIHKSKGLEFDHVIIPFCDWMLEMHNTSLWCKPPKESAFGQLPIVPIDYSSKMLDTVYADSYRQEHLQNTVDNLNLLYVAFTRASRNLFVIGKMKATNSRSSLIGQVLPLLPDKLGGNATFTSPETDDVPMVFNYGCLALSEEVLKKRTDNVFSQPVSLQKIKIETFLYPVNFRQSNKSRDFIGNESSDDNKQQTYLKMGNILHQLLSTVRTVDDIPQALQQLEFDGVLYDEDIPASRFKSLLEKRLSHPKVANWFSNRWQLYNECTILHVNPQTGLLEERRPDRVMTNGKQMLVVDFKFGKPIEQHRKQVKEYMQLLSNMGHPSVEGYLWYVYTNQIVEVI